jgi:cytochrome bd-type quinol oxidase subunit 1
MMRACWILAAAFVLTAVAWRVLRKRDDEEMFVRLGGRDLRSLPQ